LDQALGHRLKLKRVLEQNRYQALPRTPGGQGANTTSEFFPTAFEYTAFFLLRIALFFILLNRFFLNSFLKEWFLQYFTNINRSRIQN
jgi:hypothetical protein